MIRKEEGSTSRGAPASQLGATKLTFLYSHPSSLIFML